MRRRNPFSRLETSAHQEQISSLWFILILVLYGGVFYACYFGFNSLPNANVSDDLSAPQFNSRVARDYLTNLTRYGPKVAGSEFNERHAVQYLLKEVEIIRGSMHRNHAMDVDVQRADGAVFLSSSATYQGVQNVVVRLRNSDAINPPTCLLINSHYDTVAVSPGGGDASTMIGVMLETLRVLARQEETFEHCILFLFNGCEEFHLQGSHAFITQHKWRKSAKAVLNLDSAGNGGREILFQASQGHSWLMNYYRRHAPHPFSSAMGEELFQANVIPSDTDFRIFRDYGGIPGMDLAQSTNGYVYHTQHDTDDIVPDGTLQHTGDNLLALTRALANAEELKDTAAHVDHDAVFFDYMNLFMIYYTKYEAIIINTVVMVFCLALQGISYFLNINRMGDRRCCSWAVPVLFLVQLISLAAGCVAAVALGFFYNAINLTMSWYSNSFLIFPLYMCPMFFVMSLGPAVLRRFKWKSITPWECVEHGLNFHSWLLIVVLSLMTALGIRSGFMVLVPLLFFAISLKVQIVLKLLRAGARWKLFLHYLVQLIPFGFYATWTVIAFATFIPFAGRNGVNDNPELIISAFAVGMGLLLGGFLIPTIPMFKSPIAVSLKFFVLWLIGLILIFTSVGFPYAKETAPQRQTVLHVQRTFHNLQGEIRRDHSMFFVRGSDPNQHLTADYLDMSQRLDGATECQREFLCGFPIGSAGGFATSFLFEAPTPIVPGIESDLRLVHRELIQGTTWKYSFELTCPSHCIIYLQRSSLGVVFGKWSLFQHLDDEGRSYPNPILYMSRYFNLNLDNRPDLHFTLELRIPETVTGKVLDAGILADYNAFRDNYSPEFTELLDRFPAWTTTTDWISTFKTYEF